MSDEEPDLTGLRRGRRASTSMPQGLDLLMKIAEYSWQSKPPVNSSFDDLAEAGVADAVPSPVVPSRRIGVGAGPSNYNRRTHYEPVNSESEVDEASDLSELESPTEVSPTDSKTKTPRRVGISMNPMGKNLKTKFNVDDDDDTVPKLKPLATRRKSGISPLRISDSNFLKSEGPSSDEEDENKGTSPTPSATTSFTVLLRDKLHSMPIPGLFRKKRPKEYKLQTFVAILFLTIILLVGTIYVIHQEKELQKSYYDRIRFSNKDRRIRVTNSRNKEVLRGVLNINLTKKDKPWPCLPEHLKEDQICLEWMNKARLYFRKTTNNLASSGSATAYSAVNSSIYQCYEVFWESLDPKIELKDCYELGEKWGGHFYGGGELPGSNHWPLNRTQVPYSPFLTGNKIGQISTDDQGFQWGRTLKRFFINSEGAAIQVTDETPLHVSINEEADRRLCIGAKAGSYGFTPNTEGEERAQMNYTICAGDNVRDMFTHLADKDIWDGLKHEDLQVAKSLAEFPIWRILPHTIDHGLGSEASLLNYTDQIAALHLSEGFIIIDESWQKRIGDLEMDNTRFPTMAETINITRRRGFKVALTIQPFFSTQSPNYEEGLSIGADGIWLAEKLPGSTKRQQDAVSKRGKVPALTQYKNWTSVAVLDATNKDARDWIEAKVSALVEKYGIDALHIDLGTAYDLPQFYEFSQTLSSSDYSKDLFLKALRPVPHVKTIGVSSAVKLPKLPTFIALSPTESSWSGLQSVIPNILALGVSGYPFIIPGSIGGDFFSERNNSARHQLPDRELYIRWLELVHFLPVVQYSFLPSDYDQKVVDIATKMYFIRKNKLYNYIKKAIDDATATGLPIIRPLWMIDPTDPNCLKVSDEFSIGGDIIVAPMIRPGEGEREIYLPKGRWKDEIDGSSTKGEKWLHHYRVKDNRIPYFTKISEFAGPIAP